MIKEDKISMEFNKFKDEIELTLRQNNVECALYPLIYRVMISALSKDAFSLMDTTDLKKQRGSNVEAFAIRMYEYEKDGKKANGAADYLIADREFTYEATSRDKIYGCIEIKALNKNPGENISDKPQFRAELLSFGKLIVTTGLIWRFYTAERDKRGSQGKKPERC